ncbi:MAG TPA: sodium:proton antiporter NhaD [Cyclobacteriaceae bacterium]|nr:sodium:proton antiporter NhaD [Cyclobacteriaceae bacterium]
MELLIVAVFVAGYLLIALEHPIRINKTATALLTGVICWTIFMLSGPTQSLLQSTEYSGLAETLRGATSATDGEIHREYVIHSLGEHLSEIAQILFFLIGAMTIVELVDSHRGFKFVTDRIRTTNPKKLLWVICWVTFILSAILDNLTSTIVMVSLTRKLVANRDTRLFFAGLIVVAANAGGAWSPIGDVTTTMLWIGGQITAPAIIKSLIVPSIVCMLVPLIVLSFTMKGTLGEGRAPGTEEKAPPTANLMLVVGVSSLISVPVFKTLTHLPPYLGMMLGLSVLWVVSEFANRRLEEPEKNGYTAMHALSRIDMPSVLFFLGILLAVGSLQSMHMLQDFAVFLNDTLGDNRIIITLIGMLSAIVDNVPLVAASMGMYSMEIYPTDHLIWEYLAYCAGTGGSLLVIGSAAGVAAMGMEKIDFIWYLRKITLLAAIGYFAGAATYLFLTHA